MYRIQNNKGHTLIEMLIVLLLVSFLSILTLHIPKQLYSEVEVELFINTVKHQLYLTQQYAIISGQETQFTLDSGQGIVTSSLPNSQMIRIPQSVHVNSVNYHFARFTGHVIRFKKAIFKSQHYTYILHIQFGRGVFWIEKIKR